MNDIEQIKDFVESRRKYNLDAAKKCPTAYFANCAIEDTTILSFLDTISQEKPSEDLEKELNKWRHRHFVGERDGHYSGEYLTRESQLELAYHFAAWQKNKIMEKAVDGEVEELLTFREPSQFLAVSAPCPEGFKDGEKVKVIIVKED